MFTFVVVFRWFFKFVFCVCYIVQFCFRGRLFVVDDTVASLFIVDNGTGRLVLILVPVVCC